MVLFGKREGGAKLSPGDLVKVKGYRTDSLGLIIDIQGGTGLYRVWLLGQPDLYKVFRYSKEMLEVVG